MSTFNFLTLVLMTAAVCARPHADNDSADGVAPSPTEGETVDLRHRPHHGYGYGGYGGYGGHGGYGGYYPSYGYNHHHHGYQQPYYGGYNNGYYGYGYGRPGILGAVGNVLDNLLGFREKPTDASVAAAPVDGTVAAPVDGAVAADLPPSAPAVPVPAEPEDASSTGDGIVFQ